MAARPSFRRIALGLAAVCAAFLGAPSAGAADVPAGAKAYVPVDEGTLAVVDLATMTTVRTIAIGAEPRGLDSSPDQALVYVANSQGSVVAGELATGTGSVIDTAADVVTETIVLSTIGPYDCAVTPDGARLYVACNSGVVSVIDSGTRTETGGTSRGVAVVVPIEIVDSFFLPKKVADKKNAGAPAKSVFNASGSFDTGSKVVDLTSTATLSVGGFDIDIPSLSASRNGRTFTYQAGGVKFVVVKNPLGSSRAKFRLIYTGDLGATVPTNGTVELRSSNDAVDGNCEVLLQNGGFRLGKKRGALSKPNVFVVRSHAFVNGGGKDSLAIIVGLATGGVTPGAAPEVRVQYGSVLTATIPATSFVRKGESYVFKGDIGGISNAILDYLREQVTIVGKDLDPGTFPAGQSPLTIIVGVGVGTDDRGVAVRVARKGNPLKF